MSYRPPMALSSPTLAPSYIEDCLKRRVIFFTGKGGVGKSSLAWATALACQKAGAKVRLASWAPFSEAAPPDWVTARIPWEKLETLTCFKEYILRHFKVEPLYGLVFENKIFRSFVLAAPGLAETVVAGKIWDMVDNREQDLLIVDLPASGHAVSFFQSTLGVQKIFPIGFVHEKTTQILEMWKSDDCRIDLVSLPEEMPVTESLELKAQLEEVIRRELGFFVMNRCLPEFDLSQPSDITPELASERERYNYRKEEEARLVEAARQSELPVVVIPRFAEPSLQILIEQIQAHLTKGESK